MESVRPASRKLGRALPWEPTHDVYFRFADLLATTQSMPPLYIEQATLLTIERRLREGDVPLPFGVLAGNRYIEPRFNREYLVIDEVIPAHIEPTAPSMTDALAKELREVSAIAEQRGRIAIGWYLGGADVLEPVAREDAALHSSIFPEPWQVMLVRDNVDAPRHGAFIRIEPSDHRPYASRFFELIPDSVFVNERETRTALRWENYETTEPVIHIDEANNQPLGSPPKEGILQKLSHLRKRIATPSPAARKQVSVRKPPVAEPSAPAAPRPAPPRPASRAPHSAPPPEPSLVIPPAVAASPPPAATPVSSAPPAAAGRSVTPAPIPRPSAKTPARTSRTVESKPAHAARKRESADERGTRTGRRTGDAPVIAGTRTPPFKAETREIPIPTTAEPDASLMPSGPEPAEIRLSVGSLTLAQGDSIQLGASAVDVAGNVISNVPFRYASSDPSIVTVSSKGVATSVGPGGSVVITIQAANLQQIVPIDVVAAGAAIEARPSTVRMPQHGTQQLEARLLGATGAPVSGATITYSSSEPSIVSVSPNGHLTSLGPSGAASIVVRSGSVSFVVQVMVTQVASSIEVSPNPAEVSGKRRRRLTARLLDAVGAPMKGHSLVFSSSDPAVVAVSSDGVLAAGESRGGATVTVHARGTSLRAYVPVHVVNATRRTGRVVANASIANAFSAVPVSADEAYVAPLGAPVVCVNLATGATVPIPGSEGGFGIAFCRTRGEVYAGAYVRKTLDVISVERRSVIATIQLPDRVVDIVVSRDARFAYLGLSNGIAVLDLQAREVKKLGVPVFGLHLALHPSRPLLYVSGNGPAVSEIDLTTGKQARTFALKEPALGQAVGVTPDGAALYIANELANGIDVFELSTGRLIRSMELPLGGVWGMVLSPDGKRLFANGAGSGGIVAIDSATGHVLKTYASTGGHRLALSADGLTLLAAGAGNGLLVMR